MANSNPYLILRRIRDSVIKQLRDLFRPENNTAVVPAFKYNYIETASKGFVQFFGNPIAGDTVTIGTNVITFVAAAPGANQVLIGLTVVQSQANFVAFVNANSSTLFVSATTNTIPKQVNLKANVTGPAGNTIALAVGSTSPSGPVIRTSGPTLREGGLYDFDASEIFISDVIPQDYQDWPALVVTTQSVNETRYLGPEDQGWSRDSFGVVTQDAIFSSLVATVNINLYIVDDTIARDEIIDLIYNNISELRDSLAINGIEMIDRTMPTESRVFQDQRWFIENHFTLRVYAEWTDKLTPIVNVTNVSLTIPLDSSPAPIITSPISASGPEQIAFNIISINSGTGLTVDNNQGLSVADDLVQGANTRNITSVAAFPDTTHITVNSTGSLVAGPAIAFILPFTYQITAINNPTSYGATGLPMGLSIDTGNGLISGIPLETGTFYVTLTATNGTGTGTGALTLTVVTV